MAEINEDAPPAEPIAVAVSLDQPPRAPFDVPVFPDSSPGEPIEVSISPDLPPMEPFDVAVGPDPSPRTPFAVPVSPDAPPRDPFQVPIDPDAPPADPFDVPLVLDRPPRAPFDVPTSPDAPPRSPVPVNTSPDAPPRAPVPVDVRPDAPPRPPTAVTVTPDSPPRPLTPVEIVRSRPPAAPFLVDVVPDLPSLQIKGRPGDAPTIDAITEAVRTFDRTLGSFLDFLVELNPVTTSGPGGGALDPTALARWFGDYTRAVGTAGVARFIEQQTVLYGMNSTVSRIFDPTYFLKMLVPGSMGHARTTVDSEIGITLETVAHARDAALNVAVSLNPLKPGGNGLSDIPDTYGPENTLVDGQAFTVDGMVDAALPGLSDTVGGGEFLKREDGVLRFDATAYFDARGADGMQRVRVTTKAAAASGLINAFQSKLASSNALNGIIRVSVKGEGGDGAVLSTTQDPSDVVDDDDARVPLSFTDLRKDPVKNAYRSVYFRPENLEFNTTFTPEYSEGSSFGRTDPIVGYQKTTRTVSVSFEVHAFAPEDLRVMYNKMTWLASMCYPSFGDDALLKSGPVVRMRVGDAISSELGGVPGVIRSLGFNFEGALWELKRGMKVPRSFKVALDFLVLHDGPVGLLNGVFGVFQLPPGGNDPNKDTNLAGNPNDSRTDGTPTGFLVLPGRFSKFGEPQR